MPKFRYYITDLMDGTIRGTDDPETAHEYAATEDAFVVDTERGVWIRQEGYQFDIERAKSQEEYADGLGSTASPDEDGPQEQYC